MGSWNINVQGKGSCHNGKPEIDADLMAVEFVAFLRSKGHTVGSASFTSGGKIDLLESSQPSGATYAGIVNGKSAILAGTMTYEAIRLLAGFPDASHPSMTYAKARFGKEGILHPGESVGCTQGTVFSVADTGNA